jgi:hypothetical protein
MRGARRGAGLLALLVTTLGAVVTTAPGAEAASGRCTPGTGVTVVVDYGSLGRSSGIGCATNGGGQAASQSVPAAGFALTYASGQPFVCRIDGLPDATQEPCNRTPPADAYWGLFWNDGKGGGWVYSSQGAASLRVPAGGSIGWRWQDGGSRDLPGVAPNPPAPASSPTKPPKDDGGKPHSASPTPAPTPTSATPSATPSASAAPQSAAGGKKKAARALQDEKTMKKPNHEKPKEPKEKEKASPSSSPTPSQSVDGGEQVTATRPTAATPSGDDGTDQVVLLAGIGAVLLLGAAAGVLAWRRRV